LPVDEFGCALSDLVASPDKALGAEQTRLRKIRTELTRWPSTADLQPLIPDPDAPTSSLPALLFERDLPRSLMEASNVVRQLDTALMALLQTRALREMEILRAGPMFDAENADVRNEDHELMEMDRIEQSLTDSLNQHQQLFLNLSNIVRATGNVVPRQRLQIASFDTERGAAILTDGRRLLLPKPGTPGAPPLGSITDALVEGSFVDVDLSVLPDGTLYGNSAASTAGVNSSVVAQINPRRLVLRVTPVDFGLPNFDLAPRHYLQAYKWGFTENLSRHYFEFGQAFAAVKLISPGGSGGNYKHWLKIDYDANNDGLYGTLMPKLDETTPPFVLKADTLPQYKAFNIRVREYRAEVVNGVPGTAEVIGEEIYLIELNPTGTYAEAFYDQTSFDLADSPSETGHRVAEVTDIARRFPLTLKPLNEMAFSGASYKANGNSSSYPNVLNIGLNDPFAVHFKDPNADLFFANPDDYDKGIYGPRLKGYNHNREFHYRVALPFIARDRLHDCSGSQPDTFYRIPLSGVYSVSQGNNGQFTHNLWQRYAWDFPKSGGTTVRAARGGTVVDMRESSSQSCWNSGAQMCQNCSGSASPNFVSIRHRDGTTAWYGHFQNNKVYVSIGQRVYRGTSLGGVGTTGCSTGNHLHFHVVNPEQTTTIPLRFESFMWPVPVFVPCYLPPSNSQGFSNNQ
jgi:murein DD-endopeptidase MepM/ murein hydrolase activator NlpD